MLAVLELAEFTYKDVQTTRGINESTTLLNYITSSQPKNSRQIQ